MVNRQLKECAHHIVKYKAAEATVGTHTTQIPTNLLRRQAHSGVKRNNGNQIDNVEGVPEEGAAVGAAEEAQGKLKGEPRDAQDLDDVEGLKIAVIPARRMKMRGWEVNKRRQYSKYSTLLQLQHDACIECPSVGAPKDTCRVDAAHVSGYAQDKGAGAVDGWLAGVALHAQAIVGQRRGNEAAHRKLGQGVSGASLVEWVQQARRLQGQRPATRRERRY